MDSPAPEDRANNPEERLPQRIDKKPAETELAVTLSQANFGQIQVIGIKPGTLGPVLRRDSGSAATEVLKDAEFIECLAQQMAYRDSKCPERATAKVIDDIRAVEIAGEPPRVRAAARSLKWAVTDLFQEVVASDKDAGESNTSRPLIVKTVFHSATILNMIQNAAAALDDRTLWDTLASFLDVIAAPTLAMKLKELEAEDIRIVKSAAESLFGDILDCARGVLRSGDPTRLLVGNLVLKRIVHLIEAHNLRAASEQQDVLEVQDVIAILFSKQLAQEMNSQDPENTPLCSLLAVSSDSAFRLFEQAATNFSKLRQEDFPDPPELVFNAKERALNEKRRVRINAAQTMMSCACMLWPEPYSDLLMRRIQAGTLEQRLVYLQALRYGINHDPARAQFAVAENLAILQERAKGSQTKRVETIQREAQGLLEELSDPLIEYLSAGGLKRFESLPDMLRQKVLWEILIPACAAPDTSKERRLGVLPLFEHEVQQRGPKLFMRAGIDKLLTPDLIEGLGPAQRNELLNPIFEGFTTAYSEERAAAQDFVSTGSPALVRKYKPLIEAFGADGLVFGLKEAAGKRERLPLEAITLIHLVGESVRGVSIDTPAAKRLINNAVADYLLPLFLHYVSAKEGEAQDEAAPPPHKNAEAEADVEPRVAGGRQNDPDWLIHEALFDQEEEEETQSRFQTPGASASFAPHAAALCGYALREFAAHPGVQTDVAPLVLAKLEDREIQSALTKYYVGKSCALPLPDGIDKILAQHLQTARDKADNDDVRAALLSLRNLLQKQDGLWPEPAGSPLFQVVAEKLAEQRARGFAYSPSVDGASAWDRRTLDEALCLLTDYHAKLPGDKRADVEVELLKTIKVWSKGYGAAPALSISDRTMFACAKRILQQHANAESKGYIAFFLCEAVEREIRHGTSASRRTAVMHSAALPFFEEALRHVGAGDRVKRSRDDERGELVRPLLLTLREKLRSQFSDSSNPAPQKRTVEESQIPRLERPDSGPGFPLLE